jgi:hypothetical protein
VTDYDDHDYDWWWLWLKLIVIMMLLYSPLDVGAKLLVKSYTSVSSS